VEDKKLVLIIEDYENLALAQKEYLEDHNIEVIVAYSLDEAGKALKEFGPWLALIILDARLNSAKINSTPLIQEARKNHCDKPIIATSEDDSDLEILIKAGATHSAEKSQAVLIALQILKNKGS